MWVTFTFGQDKDYKCMGVNTTQFVSECSHGESQDCYVLGIIPLLTLWRLTRLECPTIHNVIPMGKLLKYRQQRVKAALYLPVMLSFMYNLYEWSNISIKRTCWYIFYWLDCEIYGITPWSKLVAIYIYIYIYTHVLPQRLIHLM